MGETTAGAANPGSGYRLGDHFLAFIPRGRAVNPITKTNWEGVGVQPDLAVPEAEALKTAHLTALRQLVRNTTNENELAARRSALKSAEREYAEQEK